MPTSNHKMATYHNPVIVCSLNEQGRAFITNLRHRDREQQIVALIRQIKEDHPTFCQQYEVALVEGDARQVSGLQAIAAQAAKALIACSHSDTTNLQIAGAVQQILDERPADAAPLDLYVAVSDTTSPLLEASEHLNPYVYKVESLVARWYFNQYPPHVWADQHGQQQVHLVFAGFSPLVEALMCQYAKISPYKDFAPPVFTLLGPDAEQQRQALVARYPVFANGRTGAEQVIGGLYAVQCDEQFELVEALFEQVANPEGKPVPPTAVLFCGVGDELNLRRAMNLHRQNVHFKCWQVPFHVYQKRSAGTQSGDGLTPFGMAEQVFDLERLVAVERNARAVHEAYRQTMLAADPGVATSSDSLKPWEQLSETYRAANRRAGDHFSVKLASIGYPVEPGKPLVLDDAIRLDEPPERRELLSRLEHRSWRYERLLNGWRYGKVRDNQRLLHPSMVLWEDLSESEREKDVSQMESVRQVLMAQQMS